MIITSERISLKHLLTAEALTDREVMGLRTSIFCNKLVF